jgi:hypothetical protein
VGVEDFDLLTVIGKGSFGKVLQVRKRDTGQIYAMKVGTEESGAESWGAGFFFSMLTPLFPPRRC